MTKEHSLRKLFLGTALASTLFAGTSCSSTKKLTNDSELLKQKIEQIDYNEDYQLLPEQYATGDIKEFNRIHKALSVIESVNDPETKDMLRATKRRGVKIVFSDGLETEDGTYNNVTDIITIRRGVSDDKLVTTLYHEMVHVVQNMKKAIVPIGLKDLDQAFVLGRSIEADAAARATLLGYKLKLLGHPEYFNCIHTPVAPAIEFSARKDKKNIENGEALRAGFDACFSDSDFKSYYDASTIKHISSFVRDDESMSKIYSCSEYKPHDFYRALGIYNGKNYILDLKGKGEITGEYYSKKSKTSDKSIKKMQKKLNDYMARQNNTKTLELAINQNTGR